MSDRQASPRQARSLKRRLGLILVLALGAGLVVLGLAPKLISWFGKGYVERRASRELQGQVEIGALDLSWGGRQKVQDLRLLDPKGEEVLAATVELPGLFELARGRGRKLGRVSAEIRAQLVADEEGHTNLDRVLAPRSPDSKPAPRTQESGPPDALNGLEVELDVALTSFTWEDARTRAAGGPLKLDGSSAHLTLAPQGTLAVKVDGRVSGSAQGKLDARVDVQRAFAAPSSAEPPHVDASVDVSGIPVALIDNLARQQGKLAALMDRELELDAHASGTPQTGSFELRLRSGATRVEARGTLADGVLAARQGWALDAELPLTPQALELLVGPSLPPAWKVARTDPTSALHVSVPRLSLPVAKVLEVNAAGGDVLAALLAATELGLNAKLGGWRVEAPLLATESDPAGALEARDLELELRLAPTAGVARGDLSLRGTLHAGSASPLSLSASSPDVAALMGAFGGEAAAARGSLEVRAQARSLSTARVEALANAPGALARALGESLDLELTGTLGVEPGQPLRAHADVDLGSGDRRVSLVADGALPQASPASPASSGTGGALPPFEARGELNGLGLVWTLLPEAARPAASELVGDSLAFDARASAAEGRASRVTLELNGARTNLAVRATYDGERVRVSESAGVSLRLRPTSALLEHGVAAGLPAGAALHLASEDEPLLVTVDELDLPLAALRAQASAEAAPAGAAPAPDETLAAPPRQALRVLLESARAQVAIALPAMTYDHPLGRSKEGGAAQGPPGGGGAKKPDKSAGFGGRSSGGAQGGGADVQAAAAGSARIALSTLRVVATLAPDSGLSAHVSGSVEGQPADGIDLALTAVRPAELLEPVPATPARIEGHANGIPAVLLDTLAQQRGLIVDTLGPSLDAQIEAQWPVSDQPVRAKLHSANGDLEVEADLREGMLIAKGDQGLRAVTPLSPLYSQRVVGSLLPFTVGLAKPDGAPPVKIEVTDFALPFDADLRKLSATVRLDLNQVRYSVLPAYADLVGSALGADQASRVVVLEPLTLAVVKGVVRYDKIPFQLGGATYALSGSADLSTRELSLATTIPLSALGKRFLSDLGKAGNLIDPSTPVPIELSGSWSSPRISIGKAFLEEALKKAAEGALESGLRDLLDRKKKGG